MKKVILLFLIVVFVISGCCDYSCRTKKNEDYKAEALKTLNPSICAKIIDQNSFDQGKEYSKEDCYTRVAEAKQDIGICDNIQNEPSDYIKDYHKIVCYSAVAIAKRDASMCEKIDSTYMKDKCYEPIAIFTQNPDICAKIYEEVSKNECYTKVQQCKSDPRSTGCVKLGAKDCDDITIDIVKINNVPQVFFQGQGSRGFIEFDVNNTGFKKIDRLRVIVQGEKEVYTEDIIEADGLPAGINMRRRIAYDYDKYGKVKQMTWIPLLYKTGNFINCSEGKATYIP